MECQFSPAEDFVEEGCKIGIPECLAREYVNPDSPVLFDKWSNRYYAYQGNRAIILDQDAWLKMGIKRAQKNKTQAEEDNEYF